LSITCLGLEEGPCRALGRTNSIAQTVEQHKLLLTFQHDEDINITKQHIATYYISIGPSSKSKATINDIDDVEQDIKDILNGTGADKDESEWDSEVSETSKEETPIPTDYEGQRSLLQARGVKSYCEVDFLEGLPERVLHRVLDSCTALQSLQILDYCRRVPLGILLVLGAAGVGKTTIVARLILLQMGAGHQVWVFYCI
jgi:flagellar biosynthesis GTPase FlhF